MDAGKLIRKLEPLIPEQAARWRRALDLVDSDTRSLLGKEIIGTAHKILGDFRKKPLLSLPSKSKAKGSIHLGRVLYEDEKWDFGISQSELLRNVGIFGMSGSGKTNTAFHILKQLVAKRVPFLFWDWKRTARHLLPTLSGEVGIYTPGRRLSPLPFNPFIVPPGLDASVYVNHVVDVMADAYTLGDGSRSLVQKAIAACYERGNSAPMVQDVLHEVERVPAKDRVRGWKISAIRALQSLEFANLTGSASESQEKFTTTLLDRSTIVELDSLDHGSKKFLVPMMCLWLYYVQLAAARREKLKLVVLVEEAHHVLYRQERRAKESVMNLLLRQCREIGIGIIVIDQHPHLISTAALGNTYTTICLNLRDPSDINKAGSLSLLDDGEKKWFSMLPVGQAIVKMQDRWRRPFLIRIPAVDVRKGLVTDDLLQEFLRGSLTRRGLKRAVDRAFGRSSPDLVHGDPLSTQALEFLRDVVQHPDDAVRRRYRRLGMSVDRGNGIKRILVEAGILGEQEVKVAKTRKLLVRITPAARTGLGLETSVGRGSIVHEYWKRVCASRLKDQGYDVELEGPRGGMPGRVDIVARRGDESVAIEIETGKSDVLSNVRQDLMSGFDKVVVLATDEHALARIEQQLARAGLLIPTRVRVLLCSEF